MQNNENKQISETEPLVSVIIPVYNAIQFLSETIDCVFAQEYRNLEILLVDDGSTDGSAEFCDSMAKTDKRIRLFHIENSGVAAARNYALKQVHGKYVMFIDADDLVKPDYVRMMVETAEHTNALIVTCGFMDGRVFPPEAFYIYKTIHLPAVSVIEMRKCTWSGFKYFGGTVWCTLFLTTLLNGISFSTDLFVGEDTLFFAEALKRSDGLVFLDEKYYYYRMNGNSIVNSTFQYKHATDIISWERIFQLFSDQPEDYKNEINATIAIKCKQLFLRAEESHFSDEIFKRDLISKARDRNWCVLRSTGYNVRAKLCFILFALSPKLYARYIKKKDKS